MKHNEKGFIMTGILLSLPLFLMSLMVLVSLIFCIRNHDQAQSYCLKYSLQAQENIKTNLKQLLKLNPKAKLLRKKHKTLKKLYRRALTIGEPISISILKAKLLMIKKQRVMLNIRQKQILKQSAQYMESAFKTFRKKLKPMQAEQIKKEHHYPFPLAVSAHPKNSIAPVYRPKRLFSARQTLSFSWKMPLHHSLPTWITKLFFKNKLSLYHCSATIKKHKLSWKSSLTTHRRNWL